MRNTFSCIREIFVLIIHEMYNNNIYFSLYSKIYNDNEHFSYT